MKTPITFICALLLAGSLFGQTKVKRTDLIGNWKMQSVNMGGGAIYYDFTRDSIAVSDSVKRTWKGPQDSAMAMDMTGYFLKAMGEVEMQFAADGKYIEKTARKSKEGSFTFDEATSMLTTTSREVQEAKVSMNNGSMAFEIPLKDGVSMILFLRKENSK
jgi:predicted HNH restriction endonuclease